MNDIDTISLVMLVITSGYIIYFLLKIKADEKSDIAIADEEFLIEKRRARK